MEYHGTLFDPALPQGRAPATLRRVSGFLVIRCERLQHSWSPASLVVSKGGAADRLIFFRPQTSSEVSFCTDDLRVLSDPELGADPVLGVKLQTLRRKSLFGRATLLVVVCATLLLLIGSGFVAFEYSGEVWSALAKRVPPRVEKQLGDRIFPQIAKQFPPVGNEALEADFEQLTTRLFTNISDKRFMFSVHLSSRPEVNAFALPGGHIVVLSGLVEAAQTPEEILGVLAHEAAHVTERHVMQQLVRTAGVGVLFSLVVGDSAGAIAGVAQLGDLLLSRSYSRFLERDADARAIDYLLAAQVDPRGLLTFFERLQQLEKRKETKAKKEKTKDSEASRERVTMLEKALSTHPEYQERVERLRSATGSLRSPDYRAVQFDLKSFQGRLTAALKGD